MKQSVIRSMLMTATGIVFLVGLMGQRQVPAQSASTDWEQAAGGKMSFEVASVKENKSDRNTLPFSNFPLNNSDVYSSNGGVLSATNWPLIRYISFAYKLTPGEMGPVMSQLPKWVSEDLFDIQAKAAGNVSKDQMRLMMQSLLGDRFRLVMHVQTEQRPVYALVLAHPGKIQAQLIRRSDGDECDSAPVAVPSSVPQPLADDIKGVIVSCGGVVGVGPPNMPGMFCWIGRDLTMETISSWFTSPMTGLNRLVLDRTDLTGRFDFILYWAHEPPIPLPPELEANAAAGPTFVGALKDQLGMKLESTTATVDTMIIDHVEEPSPN